VLLIIFFLELQRRRRIQALHEYIEQVLYKPSGLPGSGRDYGRGSEWMESMKEGHWERIYDTTRLYQDQFEELLEWLVDEGLTSSDTITADEKLGIFIAVVGKN
jgi:hypothetical protein